MAKSPKYTGAWTWSRLADAEQCKLFFRLRHVEKREEPSSPAMERGSEIHKSLDNWLKGRTPALHPEVHKLMIPPLEKLKKEKSLLSDEAWGYTKEWEPLPVTGYFSRHDWVRAKADAVTVKSAVVTVIDFKTGKPRDVSEDQVRFYGVLGLQRYKAAKSAALALWYTDAGKIVPCEPVKRADVPKLIKDYTARAQTHVYDEETFAPTPGDHCNRCPFSRYKGGPCKY